MKFHNNIIEAASDYEYLIFDVWGVVHDGTSAYAGVVDAIKTLRNSGKKICFLSNAPRRSFKVAEVLKKYGITSDLYDFILTSGEATFLDLQKNEDENYKKFGQNYFYIGPQKDLDLLDGLNYKITSDASAADFAVATGFDGDNSVLAEKMPQLLQAAQYNLPLICVNPDLIVVKQNGLELICAGVLANEYKKLNGEVLYYGKPFAAVYHKVCELFNTSDKSKMLGKMLAIGDGMETDIKGAVDFGIDSVLITGGILSNKLQIKYGEMADKNKLETICKNYQLYPTFVIPGL